MMQPERFMSSAYRGIGGKSKQGMGVCVDRLASGFLHPSLDPVPPTA